MGIDITAYTKVKKIDCLFNTYGEPVDPFTREELDIDWFEPYKNPDFPGRADDVEDGVIYQYEEAIYCFSSSYSRYGRLREKLAELSGWPYEDYVGYDGLAKSYCASCWYGEEGLFSELINFSDCEGVIGAIVAEKLVKDFLFLRKKVESTKDAEFLKFYNGMEKAFTLILPQKTENSETTTGIVCFA